MNTFKLAFRETNSSVPAQTFSFLHYLQWGEQSDEVKIMTFEQSAIIRIFVTKKHVIDDNIIPAVCH